MVYDWSIHQIIKCFSQLEIHRKFRGWTISVTAMVTGRTQPSLIHSMTMFNVPSCPTVKYYHSTHIDYIFNFCSIQYPFLKAFKLICKKFTEYCHLLNDVFWITQDWEIYIDIYWYICNNQQHSRDCGSVSHWKIFGVRRHLNRWHIFCQSFAGARKETKLKLPRAQYSDPLNAAASLTAELPYNHCSPNLPSTLNLLRCVLDIRISIS